MIIATISLAVFLTVLSIFLHELGHALYMRKYGIPIKIFSIGFPFPIKVRFSSKRILGGTTLQLTPLLLGAFVEPTEIGQRKMEKLPYKQQADIYGAGPIANFLFAGLLILILFALTSKMGPLLGLLSPKSLTTAIMLAILFVGRRGFSRYLMIPLGIAIASLTVWSITHAPITETMTGPVGIAKMIGGAVNLTEALKIGSLLSLAIGLFNTLPLMPLDGGRIFDVLVGRCGEGIQFLYRKLTGFLLVLLVALAFVSDCAGL